MIYIIPNFLDPAADFIKDDPVRPHIPIEQRFEPNCQVIALKNCEKIEALVCLRFCSGIPASELELLSDKGLTPNVVVFYTIWSYVPGAGQKLLRRSLAFIKDNAPDIQRFVTLSPATEMARRFHIKNGAKLFRVNADTVNYEYD